MNGGQGNVPMRRAAQTCVCLLVYLLFVYLSVCCCIHFVVDFVMPSCRDCRSTLVNKTASTLWCFFFSLSLILFIIFFQSHVQELELVEDTWRGEVQDLLSQITQLQAENKRLLVNQPLKEPPVPEEDLQKQEGGFSV